MLQTLKFTGDESNFFASSDLHINQTCKSWANPLWASRGYNSKEAHREGVVKAWNANCSHNSTCFLLGDVIFEDECGDEFAILMDELNFKKLYILWGNHNSGHGIMYKQVLKAKFPEVFAVGGEVYPLEWNFARKTVVFLPQYVEISINRNFYVLSHYPVISHNKMAKESIHLSGHCHSNLPLTNKDTGEGKRLDVGWDSFGRPINFHEIKSLMKHRPIDARDHHR